MIFSLLIPTYQRKDSLRRCLELLKQQEGIESGEIVVGIDGSSDGTREFLEAYQKESALNLHFFWQENAGRASIRNRLMEEATGDLLIFLQDDIYVQEGWLQAHLKAQKEHSAAIIGYVTWDPDLEVSAYMRWLENGGHMLDFVSLKDGQETDYWHFYMGNISIPKKQLGNLRFREDLSVYGWEDILLGFEFVEKGGKVYYCRSARAFHHDVYEEEALDRYMQSIGKSAVAAHRIFPQAGIVPPRWKRFLFWMIPQLLSPFWSFLPQRTRWYWQMKSVFARSVRQELAASSYEFPLSSDR